MRIRQNLQLKDTHLREQRATSIAGGPLLSGRKRWLLTKGEQCEHDKISFFGLTTQVVFVNAFDEHAVLVPPATISNTKQIEQCRFSAHFLMNCGRKQMQSTGFIKRRSSKVSSLIIFRLLLVLNMPLPPNSDKSIPITISASKTTFSFLNLDGSSFEEWSYSRTSDPSVTKLVEGLVSGLAFLPFSLIS